MQTHIGALNPPHRVHSPSSSHHDAGNEACFGYTYSFDLSQGLPESRRSFFLYSTVCFDIIPSVLTKWFI